MTDTKELRNPTSDVMKLDEWGETLRCELPDSAILYSVLDRLIALARNGLETARYAHKADIAEEMRQKYFQQALDVIGRAESYERAMRRAVELLEMGAAAGYLYEASPKAIAVLNAALASSAPAATPRPE